MLAVQRLRYRVFVENIRARLSPLAGTPVGHEIDAFDARSEHLLVRTIDTVNSPGRVVGTCRALTPWAAQQAGGLHSENEFDLSTLQPLHAHRVALRRSCVDPALRQADMFLTLWPAFGDFMQRNDLQTMVGFASVGTRDGGHFAASLWRQLPASH